MSSCCAQRRSGHQMISSSRAKIARLTGHGTRARCHIQGLLSGKHKLSRRSWQLDDRTSRAETRCSRRTEAIKNADCSMARAGFQAVSARCSASAAGNSHDPDYHEQGNGTSVPKQPQPQPSVIVPQQPPSVYPQTPLHQAIFHMLLVVLFYQSGCLPYQSRSR